MYVVVTHISSSGIHFPLDLPVLFYLHSLHSLEANILLIMLQTSFHHAGVLNFHLGKALYLSLLAIVFVLFKVFIIIFTC